MTGRLCWCQGLQPGQGVLMPATVPGTPVKGVTQALLLAPGPAIGKPQQWIFVATIGHEMLILLIANQSAGQGEGL